MSTPDYEGSDRMPRGQRLVERYKRNYGISRDVDISEEMILAHWDLERTLKDELLDSTPETRWKTFDRCYSKLYRELDWLNRHSEVDGTPSPEERFAVWQDLIGAPPSRIYEIGSGKGALIRYLAQCGYDCTGTEVTLERGEKHTVSHENLNWAISDGVHLTKFEKENSYDAVVSCEVVEHIHPEDLPAHLQNALKILKPGGQYIFDTPHKYVGPSDVSRVFECDEPLGMHLREYTYGELTELLEASGFCRIRAIWKLPRKVSRVFPITPRPVASNLYLRHLRTTEALISLFPAQRARRSAARMAQWFVQFKPLIFITAQKPMQH